MTGRLMVAVFLTSIVSSANYPEAEGGASSFGRRLRFSYPDCQSEQQRVAFVFNVN